MKNVVYLRCVFIDFVIITQMWLEHLDILLIYVVIIDPREVSYWGLVSHFVDLRRMLYFYI